MKKNSKIIPNRRLLEARLQHGGSQRDLAAKLNTTFVTISRWERGIIIPGPYYRYQLCVLFEKSMSELGLLPDGGDTSDEQEVDPTSPCSELPSSDTMTPSLSPLCNIPFRRNPFFTGRENVLDDLYLKLHGDSSGLLTKVYALTGLGGIGKTQISLEYAYRYRDDYSSILWLQAETREIFIADLISLAELLNLPEKGEQDQQRIIEAFKRWLQRHSNWLLIVDNVEDVMIVTNILPTTFTGHIVLTTRSQATGSIAQQIEVVPMEEDEAALFLLRRAKLINLDTGIKAVSEQTRSEIRRIWQVAGGLPLALDQAGAYIEETGCNLADYLECYQMRHKELLDQRGRLSSDHPQSVAATLSLSFESVARTNPEAVELLHLCSFLHPDAISKEILVEGAPDLGPILHSLVIDPLQFDRVLSALRTYSLVQRNADTKTLSIHRLVQSVIKDSMDREMQRLWAERVVRAINHAFPTEPLKPTRHSRCQTYLPHALVCISLIDEWQMRFPEAASLLDKTAFYLMESGQYTQVEHLFTQALDMSIQTLGDQHPEVGQILYHLAEFYFYQGNYAQAELLNEQALSIWEKALGPEHPDVANALNNKAVFYHAQDKYSEAEPLYWQTLALRQRVLGLEHADVAESLNNLAYFYYSQRDYGQAEPLYKQALAMYEKVVGPECPEVARGLNNLATLYRSLNKHKEAKPLYKQALAIYEKSLGIEHREYAFCLNNLANTFHVLGKYTQAERFLRRALALREKVLGPENPDVAISLHSLAWHYFEQGKYARAERLYRQALAIREQMLGLDNALTAQTFHDLAKLYAVQGDFVSAEALYRQTLTIREKILRSDHPDIVSAQEELANLLSNMDRDVVH